MGTEANLQTKDTGSCWMKCWEVQGALINKATQTRKTDCHTTAFLSYSEYRWEEEEMWAISVGLPFTTQFANSIWTLNMNWCYKVKLDIEHINI